MLLSEESVAYIISAKLDCVGLILPVVSGELDVSRFTVVSHVRFAGKRLVSH